MVWVDDSVPAGATEAETCRGKSGRAAPKQHWWDGRGHAGGVAVGWCDRCEHPVSLKRGYLTRVIPEDQVEAVVRELGRRQLGLG
jgi:hypothetical protein